MTKYFVFRKSVVDYVHDGYECYHEGTTEYGKLLPYIVDLFPKEVEMLRHTREFTFLEIVNPDEVRDRLNVVVKDAREQAAKATIAKQKQEATLAKRQQNAAEKARKKELKQLKELQKKYGNQS